MSGYIKAWFEPKTDITAYEVALILRKLAPSPGHSVRDVYFPTDQWEELDEGVKRHFQRMSQGAAE